MSCGLEQSGSSTRKVKVMEVQNGLDDFQPMDTMILVMDPSKRDRYWENRDEKMTTRLNDTVHQLQELERRLKSLEAMQEQVSPQDRPKVQREIEVTQNIIRHSRANSVLMRSHLQVNDELEPGEIASAFRSINKDIDNLCRDISEDLAKSYGSRGSVKLSSSLDVRDMLAVQKILYGSTGVPSALIESFAGKGRPIDEFMDFSLMYLLNRELHHHIFRPFHPLMTREQDETISQTYQGVRRQDAQVISGRWRISTFQAHQSKFAQSIQQWLDAFRSGLTKEILLPFLVAVYGNAVRLSHRHEQGLASIISKAYRWNQMVKTDVILLDFQPIMFPNGTRYDPTSMRLLDPKIAPVPAEPIISTVSLGLQSSEAEGGGHPVRRVWQERVMVLTNDYFE
ncbi:hypothetical protein RhiJN_05768 [Ceratobasidium sp. AG-Ba]|nr:hypothetical protein RhiJN_05768 [Ceratobasidium sp. AG-Ba]QRW06698.1 hypothetical protein RhiLY_05697 [Ceratobasidium sp. AG-Ba]